MKINKFKKRPNGLYTLYFDDNNNYDLYEEIILKYELLIKKEITLKELEEIKKDNYNYEGYYQALKLLKKTIKTKQEIEDYLKKNNYSKDNINFATNILEKQGYINDKNYSKSYINNAIITTSKGPNKIAIELEKKGIKKEDYNFLFEEYSKKLQIDKITKIIAKKIKSNHNKSSKILKQKITIDLINLGFDKETIKEVIDTIDFKENKDIYQKEYQKYYNKLSKKYSGKELEYKLKQKMYSLGFNINE